MTVNPLKCAFGCFTIPQRYVMIFMIHLGALNAFNLRIVLNIAITVMTERNETRVIVNECPQYTYQEIEITGGTFDWSSNVEALVLYSFYIGYLISPVLGGWIADKYGPRHVLGSCVLMSTIITLLFPVAAQNGGYVAAVFARIIMGFFQGPTLPTLATFVQNWVPLKERAFLGGVAFSGPNLGTVIGSTFTGVMIKRFGDWTMPFYIWGALALTWYAFFMVMVFSLPSTHPFITEKELDYLNKSLKRHAKFKVPWKKIFTCVPVWAMLAAQLGHNYIFFTVFTYLPKYLKEILKMGIQANAAITALPFLALWISGIAFGFLSDIITNRKWLSIIHTRKLYTAFSIIAPSICIVIAVYVGCHRAGVVAMYIIALVFMGPFFPGLKVNANDLTQNYCGILTAIVNGFGALTGIAGPFVVGAITTSHSLLEWRICMWILLAFCSCTALIYVIFGKADRQEWDIIPEEEEEVKE